MIRCKRCILPSDYPNIAFNEHGVCNYCEAWSVKWENYDYEKSERELIQLFDNAKQKKRKYDCLVPFSGGRDSSYALYLCKEKYGLNPLAVTFNNTFMSEYAIRNILKLVADLGVDHVMVSYKPDVLKKFYKIMIKDGGEFCSICTAGINYVKIVYQKMYNIPLVIMGTSTRVDEQSPFEINSTHPLYVKKVLRKNRVEEREIENLFIKRQYELPALEKVKMKLMGTGYVDINLPDYIDWDNRKIQNDLDYIFGWATPDKEADHIDCKFAPIKYFLKNKVIPNYILKQQKYSQLIRDKQMTREYALSLLAEDLKKEGDEPCNLDGFLDFFGLTRNDIENRDKISHLNYISKDELIIQEGFVYKALALPWKMLKKMKCP